MKNCRIFFFCFLAFFQTLQATSINPQSVVWFANKNLELFCNPNVNLTKNIGVNEIKSIYRFFRCSTSNVSPVWIASDLWIQPCVAILRTTKSFASFVTLKTLDPKVTATAARDRCRLSSPVKSVNTPTKEFSEKSFSFFTLKIF